MCVEVIVCYIIVVFLRHGVVTGVRQGCVLSALIFLTVIDWIMKRSTDINRSTLVLSWFSDGNLCKLDFADDIALLDSSWDGMKELTNRVEEEAATVGLLISTEKTKLMAVGECDMTSDIAIQQRNIDTVEDFGYLGSTISNNSSRDKEIRTQLEKPAQYLED